MGVQGEIEGVIGVDFFVRHCLAAGEALALSQASTVVTQFYTTAQRCPPSMSTELSHQEPKNDRCKASEGEGHGVDEVQLQ